MIELLHLSAAEIIIIFAFFTYVGIASTIYDTKKKGRRDFVNLAHGLHRVLQRSEGKGTLGDLPALAREVEQLYDHYAQNSAPLRRLYGNVLEWIDEVLLIANLAGTHKGRSKKDQCGALLEPYYDTLLALKDDFAQRHLFYRCTTGQAQILKDLSALKTQENAPIVTGLVQRAEDEYIRLNLEGQKNERANFISIAIGVGGILVSVLLTILQALGG